MGCIGSSVAEILVRSSLNNITICDPDIFTVGNLVRHTLSIGSLFCSKSDEVAQRLNKLNIHANINVINSLYKRDNDISLNLDNFDIIIDCTGSAKVLSILGEYVFKSPTVVCSISVSYGCKKLFIHLSKQIQRNYGDFITCINENFVITNHDFKNIDPPRDGIGCWHPSFPGRMDDVLLASSTAIKVLENYIANKTTEQMYSIYEQKYNNDSFQGFEMVLKS